LLAKCFTFTEKHGEGNKGSKGKSEEGFGKTKENSQNRNSERKVRISHVHN
jgi:hypothetical protein